MLTKKVNQNYVQELIFILVYKLKQQETEVYNMPWWIAEKRLEQYKEYQKEVQADIDKQSKKVK